MSSVTSPTIGVWIDDESTVMISSHGMRRPKGTNFSLIASSATPTPGDSATRLSGGSSSFGGADGATGNAVGCAGCEGAEAGWNGVISRSTDCAICCPFGALRDDGSVFASVEPPRLFTRTSRSARPMRNRTSAPAGERSILRKRRGFIWKGPAVRPIRAGWRWLSRRCGTG